MRACVRKLPFPWDPRTAQALFVLEVMHNNDLRHRDIRPDNLLFYKPLEKVMVIDFAFSCGPGPEPYVTLTR